VPELRKHHGQGGGVLFVPELWEYVRVRVITGLGICDVFSGHGLSTKCPQTRHKSPTIIRRGGGQDSLFYGAETSQSLLNSYFK